MPKVKIRCPSCGRKQLRVAPDEVLREDAVCRTCAEDDAWQVERRRPIPADEQTVPVGPWLKAGVQLPF